jgi:hypothetical protein
MSSTDINVSKEELSLYQEFNSALKKVIRMSRAKLPSNDVDLSQLGKRISLLCSTDETLLLEKCYPKMWDLRTPVIERNMEFFKDPEVEKKYMSKYIKKDDQEEYMKRMVRSLKKLGLLATKAEMSEVWDTLNVMVLISAKYIKMKKLYVK